MKNEILQKIALLKKEKQYKEAIKLSKQSFEKFLDNCFLNEAYKCYALQNKRLKAIKILKKMKKTEPDSVYVLKQLAYNYYCLKDYKRGLKFYKLVIENEPLASNNYYNAGLMAHHLKDYKKALFYYGVARKLNPKNVATVNNTGLIFFETKEYKKAKTYFEYARRLSPKSPEAYHHLGKMLRDIEKDFELSIQYFKKAIFLDPNFYENYYQLGLSLIKAEKKDEAKEAFEKCLKIKPGYSSALSFVEKLK